MNSPKPIGCSIAILKANLSAVGLVRDWAEIMEYPSPKLFSRHFLQYYKIRPVLALNKARLSSIIHQLNHDSMTHDEIAWNHCLTDSKSLNKFMNYHIGFSPSQIKELPEKELKTLMENLTGKIGERN